MLLSLSMVIRMTSNGYDAVRSSQVWSVRTCVTAGRYWSNDVVGARETGVGGCDALAASLCFYGGNTGAALLCSRSRSPTFSIPHAPCEYQDASSYVLSCIRMRIRTPHATQSRASSVWNMNACHMHPAVVYTHLGHISGRGSIMWRCDREHPPSVAALCWNCPRARSCVQTALIVCTSAPVP